MVSEYVYNVLWGVVGSVGDRVSKGSHLGLVFCSWEKSCTDFEIVVVVFWAFVIALVFFVPKFLV